MVNRARIVLLMAAVLWLFSADANAQQLMLGTRGQPVLSGMHTAAYRGY
jgi:hypothetical protein